MIPGWVICIAAAWLLLVVLTTLWAERCWARAKAARILKESGIFRDKNDARRSHL